VNNGDKVDLILTTQNHSKTQKILYVLPVCGS